MSPRNTLKYLVLLTVALLWLVIAGMPFYFMTITGFKGRFELFSGRSVFAFPQDPSTATFKDILTTGSFPRYLWNSVLIVSVSGDADQAQARGVPVETTGEVPK